ncbi:MAG: hypothetical protein ABSG76_09840 [Xanthobacteraceae bacterium]|jgi:hypothetical protein
MRVNLIEGPDTHPIDIDRALKGDCSADPHERDPQLEPEAHIAVQRWIDDGNRTIFEVEMCKPRDRTAARPSGIAACYPRVLSVLRL